MPSAIRAYICFGVIAMLAVIIFGILGSVHIICRVVFSAVFAAANALGAVIRAVCINGSFLYYYFSASLTGDKIAFKVTFVKRYIKIYNAVFIFDFIDVHSF